MSGFAASWASAASWSSMGAVSTEEPPSKMSKWTLVAAGVPCEEPPGERRGSRADGFDAPSGVAPPTSDESVSDVVVSAAPPAEPNAPSCELAAAAISLISVAPRTAGAAERVTLVGLLLSFSPLSPLTESLVKDVVRGVADEVVDAAIATRSEGGSKGEMGDRISGG